MTIRDHILLLLSEGTAEEYFSGAEIAARLAVSRTAVWKTIRTLRKEGFSIEGTTNRGYRLTQPADILSVERITELIDDLDESLRVEVYDCLDSTNTFLQKRAAEGEPEGLVAVADRQTQGRGRKRREYYCPPGTGLYFSILLRPPFPAADSAFLTVAAAAAAAQAIETISGQSTGIKWVNDVWMNGKKVCGILTEASVSLETSRLDYAIVGIGINVYEPREGFPEELSGIAAAVFPHEQIRQNIRGRLLAEILRNFLPYYRHIENRPFYNEYKRRSFTIGRQITVIGAENSRPAHVLDVDRECHLIVRYEDGTVQALNSGEISIRLS